MPTSYTKRIDDDLDTRKELAILQCYTTSDELGWFISEVGDSEQPCTKDTVYYYGPSEDELPPKSGWISKSSNCLFCQGEDPPPTLLGVWDEDEDLLQTLYIDYLSMMKDWPETRKSSMADHLLFEHDIGYEQRVTMRKLLLKKVERIRVPYSKNSYNHYSQRVYRHGYQKLFNMIVSQIFEIEDVAEYYKVTSHLLSISNNTMKRRRRAGDETMERLKRTLTSGIRKKRLDIDDTRYLLSVVLESNPRMFGAHDFLISEKEIIEPEKPKPAPRSQTNREPKIVLRPQSNITKIKQRGLRLLHHNRVFFVGILLFCVTWVVVGIIISSQKITMKKIYVKSCATKRLNGNQGRKIKGLINKSGVQDIQIERKIDQPTIMYKIKASNGETYVPVHVKGTKKSIEKAVELIKEAVGKENVEEEIELPSTITYPTQETVPPRGSSVTKVVKATITLYAILYCMVYWNIDCMIFHYVPCRRLSVTIAGRVAFRYLFLFSAVILVLRATLPLTRTPKGLKVFGVLYCAYLYVWTEGCKNRHESCEVWADLGWCRRNPEYMRKNCESSCNPLCQASLSVEFLSDLALHLVLLAIVSGMIILLLQVMAYCLSVVNLHFGFSTWLDVIKVWEWLRSFLISIFSSIIRILRMPFELYQANVESSQAKNLMSKQDKEEQVDTDADSYVSVHLIGQTQTNEDLPTSSSALIDDNGALMDEPSLIVSPSSSASMNGFGTHQDHDVVVDIAAGHTAQGESNGSLAGGNDASEATQSDEVPPEAPSLLDHITNFLYSWSERDEAQRREAVLARSNQGPSSTLSIEEEEVQSEVVDEDNGLAGKTTSIPDEVPSEIDIHSSHSVTRETITKASLESLNDRNNTSNFTVDANDPLFIFLRSQDQCIKGSVDEFYTWLVTSEDIDSIMALKEAVCDDNYLNKTMRVGDGNSGLKGFKREVFKLAVSEYEDSKSSEVDAREKASNSNPSEPPEELVCPISLILMTDDPVLAADGITYERAYIEDWFKKSKAKISEAQENLKHNPQSESDQRVVKNGVCSPVYGSKLENLILVSNTGTRNMARAYKEKMEVE